MALGMVTTDGALHGPKLHGLATSPPPSFRPALSSRASPSASNASRPHPVNATESTIRATTPRTRRSYVRSSAGARRAPGSDHRLMCIAELRELGGTTHARVGDRLARTDGHAHLVVALQLRLGAARPHDDAAPVGELEHEHVRRRQTTFASHQIDDLLDRKPTDLLRRLAAKPRHRRLDLRDAFAALLRQRHLLGDEQTDAAIDIVEVIEHGLATRAIPRDELGEDHACRHAVLVADERPDRVAERFLVAPHEPALVLALVVHGG